MELIQERAKAIKEWQDLAITKCEIQFSCGGDSMGDTEFHFYSSQDKAIAISQELQDYIEHIMYERVEFYQNSDGNYIGESGTIYVELDTDSDVDEPDFTFSKSATAQYQETITETIRIKLTDEQVEVLNKYVANISGNSDDSPDTIFKGDCILSDDDERILSELEELLKEEAQNHIFNLEGEAEMNDDWFQFNTNLEDLPNEVGLVDIRRTELLLQVSRSVTKYSESW